MYINITSLNRETEWREYMTTKKQNNSSDRCVSVHGLRNDNLDDGHAFQRIFGEGEQSTGTDAGTIG